MFEKILIANRGEIALRIIRACREMDIRTVAVYSKADEYSLPARFADEAICIGAAPSQDSYLHVPSIISAAEICDVGAIHPGYGFLAENAHFAEICESCNIRFIGPAPSVIRLFGDKSEARQIMKEEGIPVLPGSEGNVETHDEAIKIARKLGYPVMVKAAQGGGGKGLRVAHNDISLANAFMAAKSEAEAAFGNSDIYIEKQFEHPRHIEFQILADGHGNILHLNERDCSIQRRHQKLIEESPSPALEGKLRARMGKTAVRVAEIAGYESAGTVEFLLDKKGDYYFIEMNTRVQVEHPVTEVVTQIDIVKEQIRIAWGKKLEFEQKDIRMHGHAIECRINAEDPSRDFSSCPGKITDYFPPGGPGIRVDSHVYSGYEIPVHYDSMIAKVITVGRLRETAIMRMQRALDEYIIGGVKTTLPFHRKVLADPRFRKGRYTTSFVDEYLRK